MENRTTINTEESGQSLVQSSLSQLKKPLQKILFGSPGTGKTYKINTDYIDALKIEPGGRNHIPIVFHPEYTYGDFMGKLMPLSKTEQGDKSRVEYQFYAGHFLKALGRAYKNIIQSYLDQESAIEEVIKIYKKSIAKTNIEASFTDDEKEELERRKEAVVRAAPKNVLLVIDEINRGNSAAIFGTAFQLLDRNSQGWSEYTVQISDLEYVGLEHEMGFRYIRYFKSEKWHEEFLFDGESINEQKYSKLKESVFQEIEGEGIKMSDRKIKIPPNLHIVATMNTSDNSIFFMDNAFKRRWDWEFVDTFIDKEEQPRQIREKQIFLWEEYAGIWPNFVNKLNLFIRSNYKVIRKIEDKQIGYFFLDDEEITEEQIRSKLMFFVWDSVFPNNKKPLVELLWGKDYVRQNEHKLVTFGQFVKEDNVKIFVDRITNFDPRNSDNV